MTSALHLRQYDRRMHTYRIGDAAALLGVSADSVRRQELELEPGVVPAVAAIKPTNVVVERP